jgi:Fe-S oxidoreductase
VDEGRDPTPPAGSGPAVAAGVRLSVVQEAYGRYADHATRCWTCRAIDERCDVGEQLHRAYRKVGDEAHRQLMGE